MIKPSLARHLRAADQIEGDSFLAKFASPLAAANAIEIQERLSSASDGIRLRIGLNLGEVIVQEDGAVYGDAINIAARLEGLAVPGGILPLGQSARGDRRQGRRSVRRSRAGILRLGMVEDIITALPRFNSLFVIARNRASPTRQRPSTSKGSAASSACATCWKEASGRRADGLASLVS